MSNRGIMTAMIGSLLIFVGGCGDSNAKFVKPEAQWAPPQKVAVLLFDNLANDEDGPVLLRLLTADRLAGKGYDVQDQTVTEQKLRDLGINYGGQLKSITPKELSKKLGVDGLFYGTVINFDYTIGLLDTTKYVRVNLKFVDGWRDDKFWEGEQEHKDVQTRVGALMSLDAGNIVRDTAIDIGKDVVVKAVRKSLKSLLGHPLYEESSEAVRLTLESLPYYRGGYTEPSK